MLTHTVDTHSRSYPPELEIQPLSHAPNAVCYVPGSKSITNRALVLAALGSWKHGCNLHGALQSEDTEIMVECLRQLGYRIQVYWPTLRVLSNKHGLVPVDNADLFVGNSGTTMRFLTALCAVGKGRFRLHGVPRMHERPIQELLTTLQACGVNAYSENGDGCPPVRIESNGLTGQGAALISGGRSSQFISALLMVAPYNERGSLDFSLKLDGRLVSKPYIRMTEAMMREWGATWRYDPHEQTYHFAFESWLNYHGPEEYTIEPDASAASYFFAAAAITGGKVTVAGMFRDMLQGDVKFVDVLEQMGCVVEENDVGITVTGRPLKGVSVDMNAISDTVMTLAAVACFADGPTTIQNIGHIRHKETDRITALATELRKLGVEVEEHPDDVVITPRPLTGASVDTYNDHRMAMSLALVGLKVPGVVVQDPGCVVKTYPRFWQDLEKLRE